MGKRKSRQKSQSRVRRNRARNLINNLENVKDRNLAQTTPEEASYVYDNAETDVYTIADNNASNIAVSEEGKMSPDGFIIDEGPSLDEPAYKIEGRRIVDLQHFFEECKRIDQHATQFGCSLKNLTIVKEIKRGFESDLVLECNICKVHLRISLTKEVEIGINMAAVLGITGIGCGFSQLEEFSSTLEIPCFSDKKYDEIEKKIGETWEEIADRNMMEAAKEEADAAKSRGDVDPVDGIPFITVVTDACWSKRSYRKNYSALSGAAVVVGLYTGKVISLGVKNKYCVKCLRGGKKENFDHKCNINFSGPSTLMESDILQEAFQSSVEKNGLRYLTMLSDGDSSSYQKILKCDPYNGRQINKIECCNHLMPNFRNKLEAISRGCKTGLRGLLTSRLERIRKDILSAVKQRNLLT